MATCSDEQLEKMKAEHPDWTLIRIGVQGGDIVIRNPSEAEHNVFSAQFWEKGGEPVAYRNALVQQCVFPDRSELLKMLSRWPGLPSNGKVAKAITYLSGMTDKLEGEGLRVL